MQTSYLQLSAQERDARMAMQLEQASARAMARALGRAPSTITRALRRNGDVPAREQGTDGTLTHCRRLRRTSGWRA
ncbi:helix-turn-helix domain-containing protein [Xanthomonas theicola]|nr:helix-turn-helix domain-containing protein [Xanthomonas theicola]